MRIAEKKIGGIHQRLIFLLGFHLETPQRRLRKRIMHRATFVGVAAYSPVFEIFLEQQRLRPAALESHDAPRAKLPAVQPDVIRAHTRRKPALVKKFAPPLVNLQPQLPLFRIPIQVEITRQLLRPRRLLRNRRRLPRLGPPPSTMRRHQRTRHQQNTPPKLRHIPPSKLAEWFYNRFHTMANSYRCD